MEIEMNITEIATLIISSGSSVAIFTLIFKMGKYTQKIDHNTQRIDQVCQEIQEMRKENKVNLEKADQRFDKFELEMKQEFKEVKSELSNLRERIVKVEWVADTVKSLLRINVTNEEDKKPETKYLRKSEKTETK